MPELKDNLPISLEECREHLGDQEKDMTDDQIRELRDALYAAINSILDKCFVFGSVFNDHG